MTLFENTTPTTEPTGEGWSRLWAFGQPHYVRGRSALCGLNANADALTLTAEPDQHVTPINHKKAACVHCERKLAAERKGLR